MRYRTALFIIPPLKRQIPAPFAGIGYLSAFLTENGIDNDVFDMNLGGRKNSVFKKISQLKPDLIGIPVMTNGSNEVYGLIARIKNTCNVDIVIGGPHVSILRSKVLEDCQTDFAIKLEGEYALADLCKGRNLSEIDNLVYRNNGNIIENSDAKFIKDLDRLPFPAYNKFSLDKYPERNRIPMVSSRGCPYSCIQCPVSSTIGKELRVRSPENVVAEIDFCYKKGYRNFAFEDDNFTFYADRVYQICDLIEKEGFKDLRLSCPNGVRADKVDRNLLARMRQVGFRQISFGVEAGNNKILKRLKKEESIETIESAIGNACDLGFDVVLYFLVGSPGESSQDVKDSVSLALKYPVADATFFNLIPYPKTELFDWVLENNYFTKAPDQYLSNTSVYCTEPVFATPEFGIDERRQMLTFTSKVRRMIKGRHIRRRLPKWAIPKPLWSAILASDFGQNQIVNSRLFLKLRYSMYSK